MANENFSCVSIMSATRPRWTPPFYALELLREEPLRWRACRLLARRCRGGRRRKLELLLNRKRLASRCLADNLSVLSGAATTCRSAGGRRRSAAGSRSKWTLLPPAAGEPAAPLPSPSLRLGPHGVWFQLAPQRVHPRPTRPCCAAPSPPARSGCLCGTLIAARASNTPSRCAGM